MSPSQRTASGLPASTWVTVFVCVVFFFLSAMQFKIHGPNLQAWSCLALGIFWAVYSWWAPWYERRHAQRSEPDPD